MFEPNNGCVCYEPAFGRSQCPVHTDFSAFKLTPPPMYTQETIRHAQSTEHVIVGWLDELWPAVFKLFQQYPAACYGTTAKVEINGNGPKYRAVVTHATSCD